MSKVDEISQKISKVIEKANAAFIFSGECSLVISIFSELKGRIPDFPNQSDELDVIISQIDKLLSIIDSFKADTWSQNVLESTIEQTISHIKDTMDSLNESLLKINIELTNKYDVSANKISDDLHSIYGKLADPDKKEEPKVKSKLIEIEEYLNKIEKPLMGSSQKSENLSDEEYDDVENDDFTDVQIYKIKKSDYMQKETPITITENYKIYEGEMILNKEKVNIMVLDPKYYSEEKFKRIFNIVTAVNHPNLISFIGAVEEPLPYSIVTQKYGEKLSDVLKRERDQKVKDDQITIRPGYRTIIAYKIASAMAYLHSLKIINRDLCTSNILINEELNPKISNFANSRFVPDNILVMSVKTSSTCNFIAPELNDLEGYDNEVDVFSFAGILYELLTNSAPFEGKSRREAERLIQSAERPKLPDSISSDLRELIETCWSQDRTKRPSFAEIISNMLKKKIMFPQDENEVCTKQFYSVKNIKNNLLENCFTYFKQIQENINDSFVYKEEAFRIRSFLYGYQYALQDSELAKQTEITDEKTIQEIKNLEETLRKLSETITHTEMENWSGIALLQPALNIPNDILQYMETIYISLKSLGFKPTKYDYVIEDLSTDLRLIRDILLDEKSKSEDLVNTSKDLINERLNEIDNYLNEKGLEVEPDSTEINEYLHNLLHNWKDFEVPRSDFGSIRRNNSGDGCSSCVYRTKQKSTQKDVAIKELKSDFSSCIYNLKFLRREIGTLVQLNHEYLTKFIGFNIDPGKPIWIITEYIQNGDLCKYLRKKDMNGFMKTKIAFEVAEGMEYLESKRIIHRDLKPGNILISGSLNNCTPKICDFGFARAESSLSMSSRIGTPCYMAPEIIGGNYYNCKADVFSYGMILYELHSGSAPFRGKLLDEVYEKIKNNEHIHFGPNERIDGNLKSLIKDATKFEANLRPTFAEIVNRMIDRNICFNGSNSSKIREFYEEKRLKRNEE